MILHVPPLAAMLANSLEIRGLRPGMPPPLPEAETVTIEGPADLSIIAKCAETDVKTIREMNPELRRSITPYSHKTYEINIPKNSKEKFLKAFAEIPEVKRIVKTYCSVCERTCGMQVTVEDNKVIKIEGLKEHLRSKGDLCIKGRAALDIMYAPDRLKHPMKKENGDFKQINWDEALELMAHKLDELKKRYGPNSLSVYHGQTYVKNAIAMFCMKRFLHAYGTSNLCSAASECFIPHLLNGIATFGNLAFADVENSKCVIIWGSNPFASGSLVGCSMPRTIKIFTELKEKGVKFIVVDPRTPSVAKLADVHMKVRPGTDGALVLGMMRVIIEKGLHDKEYVEKYTSGFEELQEMVQAYDLGCPYQPIRHIVLDFELS